MTNLMYLVNGERTLVIATCPLCGEQTDMIVPTKGFFKYKNGTLVQEAFPEKSVEDRELLVSGMCRDCQRNFFGGE